MARKTDRNFIADFATLDIEYLPEKGPEVSSDIQMVYIMGDVTGAAVAVSSFVPGWNTPSPVSNDYTCTAFQGAVGGQRNRVELLALATGGGIWITAIENPDSSIQDYEMFTIAALSGLGTTILPTAANSSAYGTGSDATAIFEIGTSLTAAPANAERHDIGEGSSGRPEGLTGDGLTPIFIGAGRVFVVQNFSAGFGGTVGIHWREIL